MTDLTFRTHTTGTSAHDGKFIFQVDGSNTKLEIDDDGILIKNNISLVDNEAESLKIKQGNDSYITFKTTDGSEQIIFGKNSTFAGTTIANLGTVTTANIDGGTIDNTVIGGTTAVAGSFTTLTASTSMDITGPGGLILDKGQIITNPSSGTAQINGNLSLGPGNNDVTLSSNGEHNLTLQTGNLEHWFNYNNKWC